MANVSPLAPAEIAKLPPVGGVRLSTVAAGIKYPDRTDVLLALLDAGTTVAGVLTRSRCPSAPVGWWREKLRGGWRGRGRGPRAAPPRRCPPPPPVCRGSRSTPRR